MKTRRKFIYTIATFRGEAKHYIVSKEAFIDRLAIQLGDTDWVNGIGITSANYDEAEKMIRKLKQKNHCGLLCGKISYRIFDSVEFERYNADNKYVLYLGNIHNL